MAHIGKRVVKSREGIDRIKLYPIRDAVRTGQRARQREI